MVKTMLPTALMFSRYRAFRDEVKLSLPPLTLIIGRNGSGKSVLTRLPLLLGSGLLDHAESPLDLTAGGLAHASRFEDLVHQRSAQPFMLGAEIADSQSTLAFKATLRHIVERHELGYEAFELLENDEPVVRLLADTPEDIGRAHASYLLQVPDEPESVVNDVDFVGLFPSGITGKVELSDRLSAARSKFRDALTSPAYLGPFRSEVSSLGRVAQQGISTLGPRGERALDVLGDDALRGDGSLVQEVNDWFADAMNGSRVVLETIRGIPRLLVHDALRGLEVDLAETGAGFAQVLPIAVQVKANKLGRLPNIVSIIEQPELHLHPAAHGAVADLIVDDIARPDVSTRYICETHSEQLITRIRRRIAEGKIHSNHVQIVSVSHQSLDDQPAEPLRVINTDRFGNTDTWPIGVFDEALDDIVLLREAAIEREHEERANTK